MKKVVLFTAVLLLAGAVSLSAEAPKFEPSIALTGSASFTFGIELGQDATDLGLANSLDSDIALTLVPTGTDEKGGKEGEQVYGWIKLKTFRVVLDNDAGDTHTDAAADGLEAKLFLGPVFIDVIGDDDGIDEAGTILKAVHGAVTTDVLPTTDIGNLQQLHVAVTNDGTAQDGTAGSGIHIGLVDTSVISLIVGVQSAASYVGSSADSDPQAWNIFAKVGFTAVPDLTAEGLFNWSSGGGSHPNVGGKVGYALTLAEGFKLGLTGGIDVALADDTSIQVTGELTLSVPGSSFDLVTQWNAVDGDDVSLKPGLDAIFSLASVAGESTMDLGVYFYDADLIPVINVFGALEIVDLGGDASELGLGLRAAAALEGGISPYAEFRNVSNSTETTATYVTVGVDLTMVTNTTFTLEFASTNFADDTDGTGTIKFTTKIAY